MFRKKKTGEKETFQDFISESAEDTCPLCGGKGRPLFGDYLECTKCKRIFIKGGKTLKKGVCPACGSDESNPLFGDEVECKRCGYVYKK